MQLKPLLRIFGVTLLLAAAVSWGADPKTAPPTTKVFTVGGLSFSMNWDSRWTVQDAPPDAPDTLLFQTADPLQMSVTLSVGQVPADIDANEFRALVMDKTSKEFLQQSVEKELKVEPFGTGEVRGSRVCATDRAPKPGEYKYVCQGILTHHDSAVIFTVLYNDSGKADAKKALAALEALQFTTSA
jgi:hypothetical protein